MVCIDRILVCFLQHKCAEELVKDRLLNRKMHVTAIRFSLKTSNPERNRKMQLTVSLSKSQSALASENGKAFTTSTCLSVQGPCCKVVDVHCFPLHTFYVVLDTHSLPHHPLKLD
jgi:hypothetical protein